MFFSKQTIECLQQHDSLNKLSDNELYLLEGGVGCQIYETKPDNSKPSTPPGQFGNNAGSYIWNSIVTIIAGSYGLSCTPW